MKVVLLHNTTYKCGKIERRIIEMLRNTRKWTLTVKDILKKYGKRKRRYVMESIQRLRKRNIIQLQPASKQP